MSDISIKSASWDISMPLLTVAIPTKTLKEIITSVVRKMTMIVLILIYMRCYPDFLILSSFVESSLDEQIERLSMKLRSMVLQEDGLCHEIIYIILNLEVLKLLSYFPFSQALLIGSVKVYKAESKKYKFIFLSSKKAFSTLLCLLF
ncbi:MAG: hypothetical protein FWG92_05995 [Leptospirales bacterium]|nr:hypothetical protein [Leptospirales bacterium]